MYCNNKLKCLQMFGGSLSLLMRTAEEPFWSPTWSFSSSSADPFTSWSSPWDSSLPRAASGSGTWSRDSEVVHKQIRETNFQPILWRTKTFTFVNANGRWSNIVFVIWFRVVNAVTLTLMIIRLYFWIDTIDCLTIQTQKVKQIFDKTMFE